MLHSVMGGWVMVDATGGIVADPQGLRRIAGSVDATVTTLRGAHHNRALHLLVPLGAWAAPDAVSAASDTWAGYAGRLVAGVDGVAAGMRAAADGYSATDATNARLLAKGR